MKKTAITFLAGAVCALSMGAASSYIYDKKHDISAGISGARAIEYLVMFKADGVLPASAVPGWVRNCTLYRPSVSETFPTGIAVTCTAKETDTQVVADSLPAGAENIRIVN